MNIRVQKNLRDNHPLSTAPNLQIYGIYIFMLIVLHNYCQLCIYILLYKFVRILFKIFDIMI